MLLLIQVQFPSAAGGTSKFLQAELALTFLTGSERLFLVVFGCVQIVKLKKC